MYEILSFVHVKCLIYTKFLNYKNKAVKYVERVLELSMCDLCGCAVIP